MADKHVDKHETWKNFQEKMKEKHCGKKATKPKKGKGQENEKEELTVQRLSAEVHGKAQKYSRLGPREFVDFSNLEMTVENIKACTAYFRNSIGTGMVCDILAGDQGPSCRTMKQIPNLQLIHVRFIPEGDADVEIVETTTTEGCPETSIKRKTLTRSVSSPPKSKKISRIPPRSLSVSTILQLGRLVQPKTTLVNLFSFNLHSLTWSSIPVPVEFEISHDVLGEGGFRKAYKATTATKTFPHATWVIKRYKPKALVEIENINQTVEYQTKKVCNYIL